MNEPSVRTMLVDGVRVKYCRSTQVYVIEYCCWKAARPLKTEQIWLNARRYIPDLSRVNAAATVDYLSKDKKILVKLTRGVYIHKDADALLS